jgi:hypothetical protein
MDKDTLMGWCREICRTTGTEYKEFIGDFIAEEPNSRDEATKVMEKLLYIAWYTKYDQMWSADENEFAL